MKKTHEPVLLEEVIESLHVKRFARYIDCTLGAGGYTKAILKAGGEVLGIDTDLSMLKIARENLKNTNAKLVQGNFRDLKKIAEDNDFTEVDGIVFDLGVSNVHFGDEMRGFSFRNPEADLDMRLDVNSQAVKASDLLNGLRQDQLEFLFRNLPAGRQGKLAQEIVSFRKSKKFEKVRDFLSLFPDKKPGEKIHPATQAMMNLRIAVNSELDNLRDVLPQAWDLLKPGGRMVVVSFHSGEDEIVKDFIRSKGGDLEVIRPSEDEVNRNPKSRSAVLRSITKR